MSFCPLTALTVVRLRDLLQVKRPTVVDLGNQTLKVGADATAKIVKIVGAGKRAEALSTAGTTEDFYKALGFASYEAIDVNSKLGSLVMDLNCDLVRQYGFQQQFDLVVNNGTGEHIFDQKTVFTNMHNLCKLQGLMVHVMPFQFWLNHGFYNFQPKAYFDVATANYYEIIRMAIGERNGEEVELNKDAWRTRNPRNDGKPLPSLTYKGTSSLVEALRSLLDRGFRNIMVVAVLRKTREDSFRVPMDGRYLDDIEDPTIRGKYV